MFTRVVEFQPVSFPQLVFMECRFCNEISGVSLRDGMN